MTIDEIREAIKAEVAVGVESTDSLMEDAMIEQTINNKRATIISSFLTQSKMNRVSDSWVQPIEYGCNLNPYKCKDKVVFDCPAVIHINNEVDGFVYVGHSDGTKPFTRLKTSYMNLSMLDSISSKPRLLWYPEVGMGTHAIVVKGNLFIEKLKIQGIFVDPMAVPGFRRDVDDYPIDPHLADILIDEVVMSLLKKFRGRVADTAPDFTDTQAKKINR